MTITNDLFSIDNTKLLTCRGGGGKIIFLRIHIGHAFHTQINSYGVSDAYAYHFYSPAPTTRRDIDLGACQIPCYFPHVGMARSLASSHGA